MLKVGALRNGFTYRKLFHQLEEIVSELLRYLWKIPSDAHQSFLEGDFFSNLVTIDLLTELCPMVPFAAKVPHGVSQPTFA